MTPQELKNSILQWAVQGNLVPQDPNDEPAKILLEKIKAEKAELVKQKKIKADKDSSTIFRGEDNLFYETKDGITTCIQDEIPFDIPDSWEWVRLGEICIINPRNISDDNIDAGFMPMPLLKEGYNNYHQFTIRKWKEIKSGYTHFANNDIVVAKITPCFQNRKSAIIANLPNNIGAGTTELHVIRLFHETIIPNYILWFLKTAYFIDNGVKAFTGTAGQQRVGVDYFADTLFPLPPLEEQKRIVEKIESLTPLIAEYEKNYTALQNLEKSFPLDLKKSLLQWAVQGKLVPQAPNDAPAKALLEKIKAEKVKFAQKVPAPKDPTEQELIEQKTLRQKKTKIDKASSTIFRGEDNLFYETTGTTTTCIQDEIPFNIPDNWEWVRLGNICWLTDGQQSNLQNLPYLEAKYLRGKITPTIKKSGKLVNKGQYIILVDGENSGEVFLLQENGYLGSTFKILNLTINCYIPYSLLVLRHYQDMLKKRKRGAAIPHLDKTLFNNLLIPLPPLAEQKRITQKLETLKTLCTELERE